MASHSNTQKAGIMMCFRNIVIIANLNANSWMGSKLKQTISQCIVAIY